MVLDHVISVALPAGAVAIGATQLPIPGEAGGIKVIVELGALIFLCLAAWAMVVRWQLWRFALAGVVVAGLLTAGLCQTVRALHPTPQIIQALHEMGSSPAELRSWGYEEPNLVFYITHPVEFKKKPEEIASSIRWARDGNNRDVIFLLREWRLQEQIDSLLRDKAGPRNLPPITGRPSSRQWPKVLRPAWSGG